MTALKVINLLLTIPSVIFGGYTLATLWSWFITPKFGLPPLSIAEAVGIMLVAGFATGNCNWSITLIEEQLREDNPSGYIAKFGRYKATIFCTIVYPFVLLFGYIWRSFI